MKLNDRNDTLASNLNSLLAQKQQLDAQLSQASADRPDDCPERPVLLSRLEECTAELSRLDKDILAYKECDPVALDAKKNATTAALAHANRWTDNVFALQSHICRKIGWSSSGIF